MTISVQHQTMPKMSYFITLSFSPFFCRQCFLLVNVAALGWPMSTSSTVRQADGELE